MSINPQAARAAALAAAEARLRPPPPPSDDPSSTSWGPGSGPVAGRASAKEEPFVPPTEAEDRTTKRDLARKLNRGIVRDSGYKAAAECVETLHTISTNILNNWGEAKYRTLKTQNKGLKTKVLDVEGGREWLIMLGFRVQTVEFAEYLVFQPTLKRMHFLRLAAEVLAEHLTTLNSRVSNSSLSTAAHHSDEDSRKARALAEFEQDRENVKRRADREKQAREYRALAQAQAEAEAEAPAHVEAADANIDEGVGGDEQKERTAPMPTFRYEGPGEAVSSPGA